MLDFRGHNEHILIVFINMFTAILMSFHYAYSDRLMGVMSVHILDRDATFPNIIRHVSLDC